MHGRLPRVARSSFRKMPACPLMPLSQRTIGKKFAPFLQTQLRILCTFVVILSGYVQSMFPLCTTRHMSCLFMQGANHSNDYPTRGVAPSTGRAEHTVVSCRPTGHHNGVLSSRLASVGVCCVLATSVFTPHFVCRKF